VTKLAIVGYPTLSEKDRRWIESFRAANDPQAARIAAHFTLVFPAELSVESLAAHAAAVLESSRQIPFVLGQATAVPEVGGNGGHVFLVPDEGRLEIVALHDRLYEGVLRPALRSDLPFVPHVTVAAQPSWKTCQDLARELNGDLRPVPGRLREVELVEVSAAEVRPLLRFELTA
jgi:2'-5' RNA ligase